MQFSTTRLGQYQIFGELHYNLLNNRKHVKQQGGTNNKAQVMGSRAAKVDGANMLKTSTGFLYPFMCAS
jgi:hypothetical protein